MQIITNQTRRFLALLLVFALCVGMLPAFVIPASAASYNIVKTDFSSLVLSGDYAFFPKSSTEGGTAAVGNATEISLYSDYKSDLEKYYAVTAANANGTSGIVYKKVGQWQGHSVDLRIRVASMVKGTTTTKTPYVAFYQNHIGVRLRNVVDAEMNFEYLDSATQEVIPNMPSVLGIYDLDTSEYTWIKGMAPSGNVYVYTDPWIMWDSSDNISGWNPGYYVFHSGKSGSYTWGTDASTGQPWNPRADSEDPRFKVIFPLESSTFTIGYGSSNYYHDIEIGFISPPATYDPPPTKTTKSGGIVYNRTVAVNEGIEYDISKYRPLNPASNTFSIVDDMSDTPLTVKNTASDVHVYESVSGKDVTSLFDISFANKKVTATAKSGSVAQMSGKEYKMEVRTYLNEEDPDLRKFTKTVDGEEQISFENKTDDPKVRKSTVIAPTGSITIQKKLTGNTAGKSLAGWQFTAWSYASESMSGYVAQDGQLVSSKKDAGIFTTDANGKATITGLPIGADVYIYEVLDPASKIVGSPTREDGSVGAAVYGVKKDGSTVTFTNDIPDDEEENPPDEDPPQSAGTTLYNVYWDQNYDGGGVAATLQGKWVLEYAITVSDSSSTATQKVKQEVPIEWELPNDPVREGYTFMGWSENKDAKGKQPEPKDPLKSTTFYAIWEVQKHTLTWDSNGGSTVADTQQDHGSYVKTPAAPTREGYVFTGWYTDEETTNPLTADTVVDCNRTFVAGWDPEPVYVTYYDSRQGTSEVGRQEYKYGEKLNLLQAMNGTDGWAFAGWSAQNDLPLVSPNVTKHTGQSSNYWTLDVNAAWTQNTATYTTTIRWDDARNNDGCRPKSVTVGLVSSVENNSVIKTETLEYDGQDSQSTVTFTNLPITTSDASTEKIQYSSVLISYEDFDGANSYDVEDPAATSGLIGMRTISNPVTNAYATAYRYAVNNNVTNSPYATSITMTHNAVETGTDIGFTIQWEDDSNNDGVRPGAVMLGLYADGKPVTYRSVSPADCVVSADGNVWHYTFLDYQKYSAGKEITYTVGVLNDDQKSVFNGNGYHTVHQNSLPYDTVVTSKTGAVISRSIDRADQTVTVKWEDDSNRDGYRPDNVDVALYSYEWNGNAYQWEETLVDTINLSGDVTRDTWNYTFPNMPVKHDGVAIIYRAYIASELNAHVPKGSNGYSAVTNNLDITVSHNKDLKNVEATVHWDDGGNNDSIRPATVILQLYADGKELTGKDYSVILSGDSNADIWTYTFENLPIYQEGKEGTEILYTVAVKEAVQNSVYGHYVSTANGQEEELIRYTASYMAENGSTTAALADSFYPYVKLTHATDQGTILLYASWHDDQDRDGKRPSFVLFDLYKQVDGKRSYVATYNVTAGADDSWTYIIRNLPLYEDGKEITYLVELSDDVKSDLLDNYGYNTSMEGTVAHLYYTPETGSVTAQISWQDSENNDAIRPDSVTATLYANGKTTSHTLELNRENGWSATWRDVDAFYKNDSGVTGQDIVYSVQVDAPDGYSVSYVPESTTTVDPQIIYVNLSHEIETRDVPVTLYWDDDDNSDGVRPESVSVQLYANGEKLEGKTASITGAGNTWTGVFNNLPVYENGRAIYYSVHPNDNITKTYSAMTAGANLYLSYHSQQADLQVSFRFDDNANADGGRPDALYLTLTADGNPIDEADYQRTVYFDVDGTARAFVNLPVYGADGQKIKYNAAVTLDTEYGSTDYEITTSRDISLSTSGNANQIVVTLKKAYDTGMETGHIYWFDNNNQRGNRQSTLTVDLYSDASSYVVGTYTIDSEAGTVTDAYGTLVGTVSVTEWGGDGASCWTYTIGGLRQNAIYDGEAHEIYYYASARATGISNWYSVLDGRSNGMDVNLTHTHYAEDAPASTQDYTVTLTWLDNENAWGYRPNAKGVTVSLYANGTAYKTIHLDESNVSDGNPNAWAYTFTNLPTYLSGNAVVWTAEVSDTETYTAAISGGHDYSVIQMAQSMAFDIDLHWNDSENDDGLRPDSVALEVYGGAEKLGIVPLTGSGEVWTGSISDLPVWSQTEPDVPVTYTFRWSADTAKSLTDLAYTASATRYGKAADSQTFYFCAVPEWGEKAGLHTYNRCDVETTLTRDRDTTTVYGAIAWYDDNDRDGIRPEAVKVQLYADGTATGAPVTVTGWNVQWTMQYAKSSGRPIVYTMEVIDVPEGYAVTADESGRVHTLTHAPETTDVVGTVAWDDDSQVNSVYNSLGTLIHTYNEIQRTDVYVQLYQNGTAYGPPILIPAEGYGEAGSGAMQKTASYTWRNLYVNENGIPITYTMRVLSDELQDLIDNEGYILTYNKRENNYELGATVSHRFYDVSGTVYYRYESDAFLLKNVPVTAYLYNEKTGAYLSVGSTTTDIGGAFQLHGLPQGMLILRAVYDHDNYVEVGSVGVHLDRANQTGVIVTVNRDAEADSGYFTYTASGRAFYQTERSDPGTITPVPADSYVILYKMEDGTARFLGWTKTDENGGYSFSQLPTGSYTVNVVFSYDGGAYTYDSADAAADGVLFTVSGANAAWPDVVKQVNPTVTPDPEKEPADDPEQPEPEGPKPCVVNGHVYYARDGVHTSDPVPGVSVYIYADGTNALVSQTETDEAGAWTVEGLGAGSYVAVFSLAGSATRVYLFSVTETQYNAEDEITIPDQYMDQGGGVTAEISGVALDESGHTMDCLVKLMDESGKLAGIQYTDSTGRYCFTVPAGYTYRVVLAEVGIRETELAAGDPDDSMTALHHYNVGGVFTIDGEPQAGQLVTLNTIEPDGGYSIRAVTMTGEDGSYSFQVTEGGSYRIVMYVDDEVYATENISVGYQEYEPAITENGGAYSITGSYPGGYNSAVLYNKTTKVTTTAATLTGPAYDYSFDSLEPGIYELHIFHDSREAVCYLTVPADISIGCAVDVTGTAEVGTLVSIMDENGQQIGRTVLVTDGGYAFRNLPAGRYTVLVQEPVKGTVLADKTTREHDSYGRAYPSGIKAGSNWTLNIHAATVSGHVTDQNGDPIEGATVVLKSTADESAAYGVSTKADGSYAIGVAPGEYEVSAVYQMNAEHIYPSEDTETIQVTTDIQNVDMTIPRYTISGAAVRDCDGTPLSGVSVSITLEDGTVVWSGSTESDGTFTALLFPDRYTVEITGEDDSSVSEIRLEQDMNILVSLTASLKLSGVVYEADGKTPVKDAIVYYSGNTSGKAYTNAKGQFVISIPSNLAGTYSVYAEAGGNASERKSVTVTGDTSCDLKLNAASAVLSISGVVTDNDGRRLENAIVTLTYGNDKTKTVNTSTDENGAYRFYVNPGTYYLTAKYTAPNGCTYETNGETAIHVTDSSITGRNIALAMNYPVTFRVVDADGAPVSGATITYTGAAEGTVDSGENGEAAIRLPGGWYQVSATANNRTSDTMTLMLEGASEILLRVSRPGILPEPPSADSKEYTIEGDVIDPEGNPVTGATVTIYKFNDEAEQYEQYTEIYTNENGHYRVTGLPEGTYLVSVEYEISKDVDTEPTLFEIKGYARDSGGNPYVGATIHLYDQNGRLIQTTTASATGYYAFLGLSRGSYTVEIIPTEDDSAHTTKTEIEAQPSNAVIQGIVVDVDGNPVEYAVVTVTNDQGGTWTMTTGPDGKYSFELPKDGSYHVTMLYPRDDEVETEDADQEKDPDASRLEPIIISDNYTISGYVHGTDGKPVENATVVLFRDDQEISRTATDARGYYAFEKLAPGSYTVKVICLDTGVDYDVETVKPDPDGSEQNPAETMEVEGTVLTNHKRPLANAVVTLCNLDTLETQTVQTDSDGRFTFPAVPVNKYAFFAEYYHPKGTSGSALHYTTKPITDAVLVIVLSYDADLDGDGTPETIYAGKDDTFDTPDDFYQVDVDGDGIKENIYAGADGKPGTEDDHYPYDVDGDGKPETIYAGQDTKPGTADDTYKSDLDGDGTPEIIFVADDTKPGTEDDYYEKDLDGDGINERVPVRAILITFNANGGTVNGSHTLIVANYLVKTIPEAARDGFTFQGWYTELSGGDLIKTAADLDRFRKNTMLYAHWKAQTGSGAGGGGMVSPSRPVTPADPTPSQEPDSEPTVRLTTEHIAYIIGDDKGNVNPTKSITRAETAAIFYRLMDPDSRARYETAKCSFTDVPETAWYFTEVATLANAGIVNGKGNNLFDPNAPITRAEFATIAARFSGVKTYKGKDSFPDISLSWARRYINIAAKLGYVHGYEDGTFRPEKNISRAEAIQLVNNVLGRSNLTPDSLLPDMKTWPDNSDASKWYYLAIQEATNCHDSSIDPETGKESWTKLK